MSSFPSDSPVELQPVCKAIQWTDDFAVQSHLLEFLESIPHEQRSRTLDQLRWDQLPESATKSDYLEFQNTYQSHEFTIKVANKLKQIIDAERKEAQHALHAMLAELTKAPTLEAYARVAQFAADHDIELEGVSQFAPIFDSLHKLELERRDETAWHKAEKQDTIAAYEHYLSQDLPKRYAAVASKQLQSLNSDEERAWQRVKTLFDTEATNEAERQQRLVVTERYIQGHTTNWQCERSQQRVDQIRSFDQQLVADCNDGTIESAGVWNRALLTTTSGHSYSDVSRIAKVRWEHVRHESAGELIDFLEESSTAPFHSHCFDAIRRIVSVDFDSDSNLIITLGNTSLAFSACVEGVIKIENDRKHTACDEYPENSIQRKICCSEIFHILNRPLSGTDCKSLLLPSEESGLRDDLITWPLASKFLHRLNLLMRILNQGIAFEFPTENQWEYAMAARPESSCLRLSDNYEWCRDDFFPFAEDDHNSFVQTETCRSRAGSPKVLKGGFSTRFYINGRHFGDNFWGDLNGAMKNRPGPINNIKARAAGTTHDISELVAACYHYGDFRTKTFGFGSSQDSYERTRESGTTYWERKELPGVALRLIAIRQEEADS